HYWCIPTQSIGSMMVVALNDDECSWDALAQLNDVESEITTYIERLLLRTLEGGCTAPIGAIAIYNEHDDTLNFKGVLLSLDGSKKFEIQKYVTINDGKILGFYANQDN